MNSNFKFSILPILTLIAAGCATGESVSSLVGGSPVSRSSGDTQSDSVTLSSESGKPASGELYYKGQKIENCTFDLPIEMNKSVEKWITYFTGKGRERFEKYLERSEYFVPFIKPILQNAKAPEDLVFLAMIESGFNNNARSHSRAVGAWQFMSATGRRYGLDVNWWVDERRDVEKSTIAAIQYLKELNGMFGSWHLATAAYNAGEAKIGRAIKKYKTNDFWEMTSGNRKYLKAETRNYVPKLFAAAIIGKNRKQFGFQENYLKIKNVNAAMVAQKAEEKDELEKLPEALDGDKDDAQAEAEKQNEPSIEITKDSPPDPEEEAELATDSVESMLREMSNPIRTPHVNRKGEVMGDILTEVEIPSPADLFKVASAAGLTYLEFKSMNPELSRWVTPPDVKTYKLRIPLSKKDAFMKKYFDSNFQREVTFLVYKARRGDTPRSIAHRFGISADPLLDMNDVKKASSSFIPGTLVELPIPNDFVRSLASLKSLDLIDPVYPRKHRTRRYRVHRKKSQSSARTMMRSRRHSHL